MTVEKSCVVVGSGIGGLAMAALLARAGWRVTVLEANSSLIGGYAQTIGNDKYRFAAGPRYLWNFGYGQPGYRFLEKCELLDKVEMVELDRTGFDRIYVDDDGPVSVPLGWNNYEQMLKDCFPAEATGIASFFQLCRTVFDFFDFAEGRLITLDPWPSIFAKYIYSGRIGPLAVPGFWRKSNWTLQQAFEHCNISPRLQAVLFGHGMIFALTKEEVSFFAYVAATLSYHRGCYYPKQGMEGFVDALVESIRSQGGAVLAGERVVSVQATAREVAAVTTQSGESFAAGTFVANADPQQFLSLLPAGIPRAAKFPKYDYSRSLTSIFLGIRDIDALKKHFGPWNIWYAASSQNRPYHAEPKSDAQTLYLNSPTLVTDPSGSGAQCATVTGFVPSDYGTFAAIEKSGGNYEESVSQHKEMILRIIEERFISRLHDVLEYCAIRTPLDNAQAVLAPRGNVYGRRLTPHGSLQRIPWKGIIPNLYFVGSVVGFAGVASVIQNACTVYEHLSGDRMA